jgi:dimethylaniline monooxygenase (N-oxide forming)
MIFNRWSDIMAKVLPRDWLNSMMEKKMNERFDHELYGMKPKHRYDQQHPTANDDLPNRIIAGAVIVKPDIKRLTRTGVEFVDGSVADNIDTIISATGYIFGFPFIELKDLEVKNNQVNLYKLVFPPDVQPKGSLAVIGCFQPVGGFIPISELQARWAIRVFKGEFELPSSAEMWLDIERRRASLAQRYVDSTRHTIQVDYVNYQIELSQLCGCKLDLLKLFLRDPVLTYHVLFGPYCPYQNRLVGPGAWSGARQAVLTTMQRVQRGYNQGYNLKKRNDSAGLPWRILFFGFLILALIWKYLM